MRWVVAVLALAACTARPRSDPPPAPGDTLPELVVIGPDRGTFVEASVVVTGHVHDDGPVRVTVNGLAVVPAADGTFTTTLALTPGLTIVETHAIDTTGHDIRDVRAVLAGPFAPSDGSVRGAIGVRLGRGGLAALGKALAMSAGAIDFSVAGRALNPVFEVGSCVGARVDIATVTAGKVEVGLAPKPGAIDTVVTVDDVVVQLDVRYKVACIGGSTKMTVRTRARIRGELRPVLAGGRIRTTLASAAVTLDSFGMDLGGMPGPIESLVRGSVRFGVERALTKAIEAKVPALADAKLAELLARPPVTSLLGHDLAIEVVPRDVAISASGLVVAADTALVVAGGEAGRWVARPAPTEVASSPADGEVWIAPAVVDQLFAGLWAAHAFERTISVADVGPLAMLLDDQIRTIQLSLSLPPTVRTDATLELGIGDLIITMRDAAGAEVQRFAVSLRSTLTVKPGALALATTPPTIYAQLLAQRDAVGRALDATAVEGIVAGAWSLLATTIDDALARLPIPAAGRATLELGAARGGWIVLAVTVDPR
ncbi:MAG: hypothetical protein ABI867_14950 [Kofleriaceae bacterium]